MDAKAQQENGKMDAPTEAVESPHEDTQVLQRRIAELEQELRSVERLELDVRRRLDTYNQREIEVLREHLSQENDYE